MQRQLKQNVAGFAAASMVHCDWPLEQLVLYSSDVLRARDESTSMGMSTSRAYCSTTTAEHGGGLFALYLECLLALVFVLLSAPA